MKIALISDIHGNIRALDAVLAEIETENVDNIYCLGDLVGYGGKPLEVVDRIREMNILCILGNHDEMAIGKGDITVFNKFARESIIWTQSKLTNPIIQYLSSLRRSISLDNIFLTHSSPYEPEAWHYLYHISQINNSFRAMKQEIAFIGHTHIPTQFEDNDTGRKLINVGSVGQPRDRDPRACWCIYDTSTHNHIWIRTKYNIDEAVQDIMEAKLPMFLADRLYKGV